MDIRIGTRMQTYKLGVSILNANYSLVEMLASGKGSVCVLPNTGWEYYLGPF
jgi:hypothetical protein